MEFSRIKAGRASAAAATLLFAHDIAAHSLSVDDLVRLCDIGSGLPAIDVSPDGKAVVFQLVRGDPVENNYRRGWYLLRIDTAQAVPIFVGEAGQPRLRRSDEVVYGVLAASRAHWSVDSRQFAFLVDRDDGAELWISDARGRQRAKLASFDTSELDIQWVDAGTRILVRSNRDREAEKQLEGAGTRRGYLFDERFRPEYDYARPLGVACDASSRPAASQNSSICQPRLWAVDVSTHQVVRLAGIKLEEWSSNGRKKGELSNDEQTIRTRNIAWNRFGKVETSWALNEDSIVVLRQEGPSFSETAVYRQDGTNKNPALILRTRDLLEDCQLANESLICVRQSATSPQKLVRISLRGGNDTLLFDPNPELQHAKWGRVERLFWNKEPALSAFADLVYPTEYDPARKYPLIVVQYRSRGFLRGGTGDENPIHVFSSEGFFVLSLDTTIDTRPSEHLSPEEQDVKEWADLAERKREFDGLQGLLDIAIANASIDPVRIGITGLSDGAETLAYALIHSGRFAAASSSNDYWSPMLYEMGGDRVRNYMVSRFGATEADREAILKAVSTGMNAGQIRTPLLYQVPDHEMLPTLYNYRHLREAGAPVEMYVFPDEYHVKWQPAHRLSIYRRNIQWFKFWLQNKEEAEPLEADQYARWRRLRDLRGQLEVP